MEEVSPVSFAEIETIALGALQLSPLEFERMRLRHFWLKLEGYNRAQMDDFQKNAVLTRLQTVVLVNMQLPPNKRIDDPAQLWRFPWEHNPAPVIPVQTLTDEEKQEKAKILKNLFQ